MGRGRAKAKQTKVARRLKYSTPEMDLESLQRELAGQAPKRAYENPSDPYSEYGSWDEDGYDSYR